ncbi:hypothetical protein G7Z17_g12176 [Cylindrodendrum hubeiense]|uniref:Uncharacterized protein n=1 Tax=Cylindrodendrum hubeiense TaxID=595255 RepID=A0A9P5H3L7_9HYPO|nr:hypothetical protein G7Z17_g12176 [Cylindrodendrum hubeiense]
MPRTSTKRKVSITDSNGTDDFASKKVTRASRKAPAKQTTQRDNAASGSQQGRMRYIDAASALKKRKAGVNDAKRHVQKQGDDLVDFIEGQLKSHPTADEELAPDLAPVLPWMATPHPHTAWSSQTPPNPPEVMAKALDDLQGIIDAYEKMNKQTNGIENPNWMRWEQDGKELSELNEYAMGFAAQTVNYAIMPGRRGYMSEPPASAGDIERVAWELIEPGRPRKSEETWGATAQDQVKSFTGVLRLLPPKE